MRERFTKNQFIYWVVAQKNVRDSQHADLQESWKFFMGKKCGGHLQTHPHVQTLLQPHKPSEHPTLSPIHPSPHPTTNHPDTSSVYASGNPIGNPKTLVLPGMAGRGGIPTHFIPTLITHCKGVMLLCRGSASMLAAGLRSTRGNVSGYLQDSTHAVSYRTASFLPLVGKTATCCNCCAMSCTAIGL